MAGRRLSPDEQALWVALTRSIRKLPGAKTPPQVADLAPPAAAVNRPSRKTPSQPQRLTAAPAASPAAPAKKTPVAILDSGWEKRIRGGTILPDMSIDLHDHSLAAAHLRLDQAIESALMRDARVLLVVTGKPRKNNDVSSLDRRGAIRAEIGHWLERGHHATQIASVRNAHPRHGGEGALYIILRRKRTG